MYLPTFACYEYLTLLARIAIILEATVIDNFTAFSIKVPYY